MRSFVRLHHDDRMSHMDRPTISIPDFCAALYCAEGRWDALSTAPTGRIVLTARALDTGREDYYHVEFLGVRDYHVQTDSSRPESERGDRLELSVVELEGEPGAWRVWFNPLLPTQSRVPLHSDSSQRRRCCRTRAASPRRPPRAFAECAAIRARCSLTSACSCRARTA